MLVYDITNEKSFENIKNWIRNIEENASADVEKMLLGNKCELNEKRQVCFLLYDDILCSSLSFVTCRQICEQLAEWIMLKDKQANRNWHLKVVILILLYGIITVRMMSTFV